MKTKSYKDVWAKTNAKKTPLMDKHKEYTDNYGNAVREPEEWNSQEKSKKGRKKGKEGRCLFKRRPRL